MLLAATTRWPRPGSWNPRAVARLECRGDGRFCRCCALTSQDLHRHRPAKRLSTTTVYRRARSTASVVTASSVGSLGADKPLLSRIKARLGRIGDNGAWLGQLADRMIGTPCPGETAKLGSACPARLAPVEICGRGGPSYPEASVGPGRGSVCFSSLRTKSPDVRPVLYAWVGSWPYCARSAIVSQTRGKPYVSLRRPA